MLKEQIKKFSLKELQELEKYDLQYVALEKLYNNLQDKELFLKLVIINSLLAYQLTMKWESYWTYFSWYFSKHKVKNLKESFQDFLSKYNKRLLQIKYKRLDKIINFIETIGQTKLENYTKDDILLLKDLVKHIKQKKDAKTIVFCIKMFIWAVRIVWYEKYPSLDIYIPVDNRISKISTKKSFWLDIAKETWYSLLLLDTLFYISLWGNINYIKNLNLKNKVQNFKNYLIINFWI